jgi:fused signal recognition particle receptor
VGLLDRLKGRLGRTRDQISDGISGVFRGGRTMDAAMLGELEELLYTSDLGPLAGDVVADLGRKHRRGEVKDEAGVRAALREILLDKLQREAGELDPRTTDGSPFVILVVGVNGSGKTTSIAKLANRYAERGLRVLVGACDTYRAAASSQLHIWADRSNVEIVKKEDGADPAAVAYEACETADVLGYDTVILDTAGRLHTQKNLMEELKKIRRVVQKRLPGAPHEVWLVMDGTNGQNAIQQAKLFREAVELTGLIVAKLDGTARGGALFTITRELGLPVRYVGTGESKELIEVFEPEAFVDAIVGAG